MKRSASSLLIVVAFLLLAGALPPRDTHGQKTPDPNDVRAKLQRIVSELAGFDQSAAAELERLSQQPVKGEFETTKEFEARGAKLREAADKRETELRAERQRRFTSLMQRAGRLMEQEFTLPTDFSLGSYDADAQVFPFRNKSGQDLGKLFVPLAEARESKAQINSAKAFVVYSFYIDFTEKVRLLPLGATLELAGRTYHTLARPMIVELAMKLLYPEYDYKRGRAPVQFDDLEEQSPIVEGDVFAKPFFTKAYTESGKDKFIVMTAAGPEENGCHACSPVIGVAGFVKTESGWKVEFAHKSIGNYSAGGFGEPPSAKLAKIGPDKHGVVFEQGYMGQGSASGEAEVLATIDHVFRQVAEFPTLQDTSAAMLEREEYVSVTGRYSFVPGPNSDFYDIRVVYRGKRAVGKGRSAVIRPFSKTVVYHFNGTEYTTNNPYR